MKFSKRTDWVNTPNPLTEAIARKRQSNQPLIDLTESNPTRCSFSWTAGAIPAAKPAGRHESPLLLPFSDPGNLIYDPDPHGLLEAREAVCEYYAAKGVKVESRQVFLTASTSEAYTLLFRLLLDPDETALVPKPSYPLFDYLADLNDVKLEKYPLRHFEAAKGGREIPLEEISRRSLRRPPRDDGAEGWRIDVPSLEEAFAAKPKALILVNPNNPTGNFAHENEREAINRLCREKDTAIISDEVFIDFRFDGQDGRRGAINRAPTFAGNDEVLTFTLGGVSKILGLPQMKLSWIVVSGPNGGARLIAPLREAIERLEIIADTYLSVNTPSQRALPEWLKKRGPMIGEIRDRLLANRRYLEGKFKNSVGAQFVAPLQSEGGWYAVLQVHSDLNDEELALRLIRDNNVIVHPGYFFDFEKENFLVLSLLLPEALFQKGVDALGEGLKN